MSSLYKYKKYFFLSVRNLSFRTLYIYKIETFILFQIIKILSYLWKLYVFSHIKVGSYFTYFFIDLNLCSRIHNQKIIRLQNSMPVES